MMKSVICWCFAVACLVGSTWAQTPPQEECQIDMFILLDESGSIKDNGGIENWYQVNNFALDVINRVKETPTSRVALATFGNKATLKFNLDVTDLATMVEAVEVLNQTTPSSNTNTSAGLYMALNEVFIGDGVRDRANVQNVLLLLTDGVPTRGLDGLTVTDETDMTQTGPLNAQVLSLTEELKDQNTLMITVGVSNRINETMLKLMATDPERDYVNVTDFNLLSQELDRIIKSTCVVLTTPIPPTDCREDADVYVLLDASGSIEENRFKIMRSFLANELVPRLGIFPTGRIQLGMMYFSSADYFLFGLNEHRTVADLQNAILAVPFMREKTNIAAPLRFLREEAFTATYGDRPGVRNIALILTDGNSNVESEQTIHESMLAKMTGIHIITVGVGNWLNEFQIETMASDPHDTNAIFVPTMDLFDMDLRDQIKELICNDKNDCSPNPCTCGANCEDKIGGYYCACSGQCVGETCDQSCLEEVDVVFAVDSSGSLDAAKFRLEMDFVRELTMRLNPEQNSLGLLRFSTDASMIYNINEHDNMEEALNAITMNYNGGSTNTPAAIDMAANKMFNNSADGRRQVLVIITDGKSGQFENTWQTAQRAREQGIEVIALGIGNQANARELNAIASGSYGVNVHYVNDFTSLLDAVSDVHEKICNNVDECESIDCGSGQQVDHVGYCDCVCPNTNAPRTGATCERECTGMMDILFIIDSSGSIRNNRWSDVTDFLGEVVSKFEVGPQATQFAAVYFSDDALVGFHFNRFSMQEDVITALDELPFMGGRTNVASAMEMAMNEMFQPGNGDRADAINIAVILSDGQSNIREGDAVPMATSLREMGVTNVVLGIGDQANTLELRGMATYPLDRNVMLAESFNDIRDNADNKRDQLISSIVEASCDDINECDTNPCQSNSDCIDLPGMYFCDCNVGRVGRNCERECTAQRDVALVLDFSNSMDETYDLIIAFAREIIYGLPVGSAASVSVVNYASVAEVHYPLNFYRDRFSALNALAFSPQGTRTNTAAAIQLLIDDVFVGDVDRNGADNIAVVLTDGGSNVNRGNTIPNAENARNNGIRMIAVAFGQSVQMGEVNGIASTPNSENVFRLRDASSVASIASDVLDQICGQ